MLQPSSVLPRAVLDNINVQTFEMYLHTDSNTDVNVTVDSLTIFRNNSILVTSVLPIAQLLDGGLTGGRLLQSVNFQPTL